MAFTIAAGSAVRQAPTRMSPQDPANRRKSEKDLREISAPRPSQDHAGIVFVYLGAACSHFAVGDPVDKVVVPTIFAIIPRQRGGR